jgi:hypothetical protein
MRRILLVLAMLSFGFGVHAPARAEGGQTPVYKRCVGDPPRQTEDPMSLPCDGSFDEDNGGNTYQGVTADEITVLIYVDYGCPNFECGRSPGTYIDLDGTPQQSCPKTWPAGNPDAANCDDILVRTARAYNIWGNDRYQTFARHVHYYMYYSAAGTPESRRADAADNWARLHPFAVIDEAFYGGHNDAYDDAMAARGTMVFGSQYPVPNALETKNAPMQWSFWPDVEHWADLYGGYVCATLAGRPASHAGDATANGGPRSFALWSTSDASKPGLRLFALLVKEKLHQCGADVVAEATYPSEGFDLEGRGVLDVSAVFAVATFETARATTVLWLGGVEGRFTPTAAMLGYHPEIVVAGDLRNDDNASGRLQSQDVWRHAWGVHLQLAMANIEDDYGYVAYTEVDPRRDDALWGTQLYRDHFMLFQAIQAGTSNLNPDNVDAGLRAAPPILSADPNVASCFFDPGDYSCVKDASEMWWDPAGIADGHPGPGCWRLAHGGVRYRAGQWPSADGAFGGAADPCTSFEGRVGIRA